MHRTCPDSGSAVATQQLRLSCPGTHVFGILEPYALLVSLFERAVTYPREGISRRIAPMVDLERYDTIMCWFSCGGPSPVFAPIARK